MNRSSEICFGMDSIIVNLAIIGEVSSVASIRTCVEIMNK